MRRIVRLIMICASATVLQACGASLFGRETPREAVAPVSQASAKGEPATPVAVQTPDDEGLAAFDTNKDGVVLKAELESGLVAAYKKDDTDGDGNLSAVELRVVNDRLMQDSDGSPIIDWNADGKIVMQEYASQWRTMFDRADVNRDGMVDAPELAGRARAPKIRPLPQPEFGGYKGKI